MSQDKNDCSCGCGGEKKPLAGVIFDLDGVLVTTDRFHFAAWKELADGLGMEFNETVNHRLRGVSRQQSLRNIYDHNKRELPEEGVFNEQCTSKNARYVELIKRMTPQDVLPGAVELLESLRKAGLKLAVASASKNSPLVLERTNLAGYFDAVSDGNNITYSKPHPEVFQKAAQMLGLPIDRCVGVEDATSGIESIHAAGMVAIGIGNQAVGADVTFGTVAQLTLDGVLKAYTLK